jgi:hypothetical protein
MCGLPLVLTCVSGSANCFALYCVPAEFEDEPKIVKPKTEADAVSEAGGTDLTQGRMRSFHDACFRELQLSFLGAADS